MDLENGICLAQQEIEQKDAKNEKVWSFHELFKGLGAKVKR